VGLQVKMPPRRNHGGRNVRVIEEGFRALQRQVQAIQEELCRGADVRRREKIEASFEEEEWDAMDPGEFRLIRAISKIGKRPKVEVSNFFRNLNPKELIDWINDMEEYFEYE
jgi:hypothetical protein